MRKLLFFIITIVLLLGGHHVKAGNHHHPDVTAKANNNNNVNDENNNANEKNNNHVRHRALTTTTTGTVKCVDLADFFYETILAVSSYPSHASCTEQEEAEIASFLQDSVNAELNALPGTIETENKICNSTINRRRRRSLWETTTSSRLLYESSSSSSSSIKRFLLHSFIYMGGGRCRYCFYDDGDQRNLRLDSVLPTSFEKNSFKKKRFPVGPAVLLEQQKEEEERDLMLLSVEKDPKDQFDPVADVSLCQATTFNLLELHSGSSADERAKKYVTWTNYKFSPVSMKADANRTTTRQRSIVGKEIDDSTKYVLGPYEPGDQFGAQLSMDSYKKILDRRVERRRQRNHDVEVAEQPVKMGIIAFGLWAFDVPADLPDDMLADEPLYMYINGIKVDLNLMYNQSANEENGPENADGSSFAGLVWHFKRTYNSDCAFGPLPDRYYSIQINAPLVVFAHKNQLDVDFIIKPGAMASHYAIARLQTYLVTVRCEVTGMDNSPFEDFKSVVESRLFHKLGLNLAHEYQSKEGHCLYDKIPIVNVNLVEKENLMDANPQCD